MLATFCERHQRNWDVYLPSVMYAYRSTPQRSSGDSPFYLMYGREPMSPADIGAGVQLRINGPTSVISWRRELVETLRDAHQLALTNIEQSQAEQRAGYDARTRELAFEPGDPVFIFTPTVATGNTSKLTSKWSGPYRVVERVDQHTYRLRDASNRVLPDLVNVRRLKHSVERPAELTFTPEAPEDQPATPPEESSEDSGSEGGEEFFKVEAILQRRRAEQGGFDYYVKWTGYSEDDNSWVHESDFNNKELINEFNRSRRSR